MSPPSPSLRAWESGVVLPLVWEKKILFKDGTVMRQVGMQLQDLRALSTFRHEACEMKIIMRSNKSIVAHKEALVVTRRLKWCILSMRLSSYFQSR